ncbi:MAG: hypothetical protein U5R48_12140 [Gammaproteobacteria bacterium]|nr:hypothetical protein [Gammaproteobacteria bacterium]
MGSLLAELMAIDVLGDVLGDVCGRSAAFRIDPLDLHPVAFRAPGSSSRIQCSLMTFTS